MTAARFHPAPHESRCTAVEVAEPGCGHPFRRRCPEKRLGGNDLCKGHAEVEAAGGRVRRVNEPRKR